MTTVHKLAQTSSHTLNWSILTKTDLILTKTDLILTFDWFSEVVRIFDGLWSVRIFHLENRQKFQNFLQGMYLLLRMCTDLVKNAFFGFVDSACCIVHLAVSAGKRLEGIYSKWMVPSSHRVPWFQPPSFFRPWVVLFGMLVLPFQRTYKSLSAWLETNYSIRKLSRTRTK